MFHMEHSMHTLEIELNLRMEEEHVKHAVVVTDSSEFIDGDPRSLLHDDEEPEDPFGNEDSHEDDQDLRWRRRELLRL
ncbi:hypothetical protein Fmac_028320 [Flemingia macrophylla]|uniref:Uncharacterized protein n=1 Tax=Flemingia macrophylla TaxID=520843 RepID=A0ABD1L777_9FABA